MSKIKKISDLRQHQIKFYEAEALVEEGSFEANMSEGRLVTVNLPDGNIVNYTVSALETAMEVKNQLSYLHDIRFFDNHEVVLCKDKNPYENMVLQDNEEFSDNLFKFDYIEIRSRQQYIETVKAMDSCINWKISRKSF